MKKYLFLMLSMVYIVSASQLFERCAVCHGSKGEKHSLNITKTIAAMKADDVVKILKEYRAGTRNTYGLGTIMNGQASKLSDEDIDKLANYIESLPPAKVAIEMPKQVKEVDGEKIFSMCAICHGDKGQKKSLGVSKKIAGMKAKEVVKILKEYRAGTRSTYGYGTMMQGQATKLSGDQMNAVAIYIESLPPIQTEQEKKDAQEQSKKMTQEEVDYNMFMDEYFKNSKNPNETFKAAKKKYEEHKKKLKDKNE